MSKENDDQPPAEKPRDEKGKYIPENKKDDQGQSQTNFTDYSFVNAFMAKQLGLSSNFADLSTKFGPEELYSHLKFVAMTNDKPQQQTQQQGLPPNQQVVPVTPQQQKFELPGKQLHKPNLNKDEFNVSFTISPEELINPKKNKK